MITIGPDGKMSALRQVLTPRNFERVVPGLTQPEVRRLLGRPAVAQTFALKRETVWDWYWRDGQQSKQFSVTFDADGRVVSSASRDDPREMTVSPQARCARYPPGGRPPTDRQSRIRGGELGRRAGRVVLLPHPHARLRARPRLEHVEPGWAFSSAWLTRPAPCLR